MTMRTTAEWHKRAGEIAEAGSQYDLDAHEFFKSSKYFRSVGRTRESAEMRALERRALLQTIMLADSAREFETQASKLTAYAFGASQQSDEDSDNTSAELYCLAAALYEEAADRYIAL